MDAPLVRIDGRRIVDRDSFHDVFAEAFGFPSFYGRNMDVWIDCMSSLGAPADGLAEVHAPQGDVIVLQIDNAEAFARRCPRLYEEFIDCAAFVNWRLLERGKPPVLALAFRKLPATETPSPSSG